MKELYKSTHVLVTPYKDDWCTAHWEEVDERGCITKEWSLVQCYDKGQVVGPDRALLKGITKMASVRTSGRKIKHARSAYRTVKSEKNIRKAYPVHKSSATGGDNENVNSTKKREAVTTGMSLDEAQAIIDALKNGTGFLGFSSSFLRSTEELLMVCPAQLGVLSKYVRDPYSIASSMKKIFNLREYLSLLIAKITIESQGVRNNIPERVLGVADLAVKLRNAIDELFDKKQGYRYDMKLASRVADLIDKFDEEARRVIRVWRNKE